MVTNGLKTAVYKWDKEEPILELAFGDFQQDSDKLEKLKKLIAKAKIKADSEKKKVGEQNEAFVFEKIPLKELINKFQKIHQYIWKKEKKKPSAVFEELIKIIFVKIQKDRELHGKFGDKLNPKNKDVIFSSYWIDSQTQNENPINDILFKNLVYTLEASIATNDKKRIFEQNEEIDLSAETIRWVVGELENIDLFGMDEDVHGRMFDYFLDATTRGQELGQFFTPRDIVSLMVELADINVSKHYVEKVFDPCCGSGGFLISALSDMFQKTELLVGLSNKDKKEIQKKIVSESIYGIDAGNDPKMYRIARMNMFLHGDGGSHIYLADSIDKELGQIGKSSLEHKREIKEVRDLFKDDIKFDVILSNPPFAMKYEREDAEHRRILAQYELGSQNGKEISSLLSSVMYLERYHELLTENGRVLAIIDDSVLSGDSYKYIREFIRERFIIEGIISLPGDAFKRSAARVKTSILILRKKHAKDVQHDVFLASTISLGLEEKIAKRIGINPTTLNATKEDEIKKIATNYRAFRAKTKAKFVYPAKNIQGRLDVKYCIRDTGRKKSLWKKAGYDSVRIEDVLTVVKTGREVAVITDTEYQLLRVNYRGDVLDGEVVLGADCSYSKLYAVKAWDVVVSNMGVGRGAIGIVPPHHENKLLSNEYTILRANSEEEAVYYSNIIKTKEILGDILTTTTGMNRGRIFWDDIKNVEVPKCLKTDSSIKKLVKSLKEYWSAYSGFHSGVSTYISVKSGELHLDDNSAKERWLAFKPPE